MYTGTLDGSVDYATQYYGVNIIIVIIIINILLLLF